MFTTFAEIEKYVLENHLKKRVALANAQDDHALDAVVNAHRKGVVDGILIGDVAEITRLLTEWGEKPEDYTLIPCEGEKEAARMAVGMAADGRADIPMKGIMQTSSFLKAVLDKEYGFVEQGSVISEATIVEFSDQKRFLIGGDCAINIAPGKEEKKKIAENCVALAKALRIDCPKVAMISAVEVVNPKIPSTVDASEIAAEGIKGAIVEGPFALDNAISPEAARHKGISSTVAGKADILVFPDLCAGNVFHKLLCHMTSYQVGSTVCGTTRPVIMCSRADSAETKYHCILTAVAQTL